MVENDKMKMLANEIKVLRARNNMTQEELANVSGVSLCAIALIERCKKKPRVTTLVKLSKALKVDENDLLHYVL